MLKLMKRNFSKCLSVLMVFSIANLSMIQVHAEMLSTSQVIEQSLSTQQRQRVAEFLQHKQVEEQFARWGVNATEARSRLNNLTDAEIAQIAGKMDQLPAGADGIGTIVGAAVLIFIILLITDLLHLTNVFSFVN